MKKDVFIETANWVAFREAISVVEDMEKGQPGLMVVYGQAGRGKTECCRTYAVRENALYLRVMEDWTPRAMLSALCKELDGSQPRTIEYCKNLVCEVMDSEPRTILVDEADRLKNVGMIEHFRDIHDLTGVPVVFIGERVLYSRIASRRRLWSRVTRTVEFEPIKVDDIMLFGLHAAGLEVPPQQAQTLKIRAEGDFRLVLLDMLDLERMARANNVDAVSEAMISKLPQTRKPKPSAEAKRRGGSR